MSEPWQELGGLPAHPVEDDTPAPKRREHFRKPFCDRCRDSSPPGHLTAFVDGDEVILSKCPCRLSPEETP